MTIAGSRNRGTLAQSFSIAMALASSGCSLIFIKGPPDHPQPGRVLECTTSKVAPGFDTVFGVLETVRTVVALAASDSSYQNAPISREVDVAAGVLLTSLFVGSAIYGFHATGRCSDIKAKLEPDEEPVPEDSSPSPPASSSTARPAPPVPAP